MRRQTPVRPPGLRISGVAAVLGGALLTACSLVGPTPSNEPSPSVAPPTQVIVPATSPTLAAVATVPPVAVAPFAASPSPVAAVSAASQPQARTSGVPRFEADPNCSTTTQQCGFVVV